METLTKNKLYEGMFLIDSALAGSDWEGIISSIRKILEKAEAEIITIKKWDDRKLAYDIKGTSRGTYILSYFKVDGGRITDIEKSVRLSEKIMRVLILNAERLSQEDIEKDTPAMKQEKETEPKSLVDRQESHSKPVRSFQRDMEEGEDSDYDDDEEETDQGAEEATEEPQSSDFDAEYGVSTEPEDNTERQPQEKQSEGFEQADKNEQL